MEAKDTVMKPEELDLLPSIDSYPPSNVDLASYFRQGKLQLAQAQAEISFKAGREEEREGILNKIFPQDIYPAHLKSWAKTIRLEQGYESTVTAFLDYLGTKWRVLKGD